MTYLMADAKPRRDPPVLLIAFAVLAAYTAVLHIRAAHRASAGVAGQHDMHHTWSGTDVKFSRQHAAMPDGTAADYTAYTSIAATVNATVNATARSTKSAADVSQVAAPNKTNPGSIRLFVGVLTAGRNRARRDAIRQTWGQDTRLARVMFVTARPSNLTIYNTLREEASHYHDILYVGHVGETYHNITYQTLAIFQAAYMYYGYVTHVLKCDDDTYLHVDRFFGYVSVLPSTKNYVGAFTEYVPHRNPISPWNAPYEIWPETQPKVRYALGIGYVLTIDLVAQLATGGATGVDCRPGPLFWYEDVAVGHWMLCLQQSQAWNVKYSDASSRFTHWGCREGDVVSHHLTLSQLRCMYARGGRCCPADSTKKSGALPLQPLSLSEQ